jgi:CRISPR-associated exonuclease Cas4
MSISSILFPLGITLLLFSLALFLLMFNERRSQRHQFITEHRRSLKLPQGDLVYEDVNGQGELLTSDAYPLVGKPSFVLRLSDGRFVPIAVQKEAINGMQPEGHHALQVAAYCLILEDYTEEPITHGILRYPDREFTIDYTPTLRKKVIRTLQEMSVCNEQHPPALQKQKAAKCRTCPFQPMCPVGQLVKTKNS